MNKIFYVLVALALLVAGVLIGRWADGRPSGSEGLKSSAPKPLYYRNPMGLADTSPVPKKDSMGMDYLPVYAEEVATGNRVRVSRDKVQKLGVRTEAASRRPIQRPVRAVGTIEADERKLTTIAPRFEGWIEELYANETGRFIQRGEALFSVYSPDLVAAQQEYLLAVEARNTLTGSLADELVQMGRERLHNWQMDEAEIRELEQSGTPRHAVIFRAPMDGVVLEKMATAGMRFMPGDVLYRLADLRTVWLMASVYEQDLAALQVGQEVMLEVDAYPGESFTGRISFIYPTVVVETRTVNVRVELDNVAMRLRPGMYGSVHAQPPPGLESVTSVPDSAVLDSGERQLVWVQLEEGLFEPREVVVGRRGDGYMEIREGVTEGEQVVVSANFLIDAESNLQAALDSFGHGDHERH